MNMHKPISHQRIAKERIVELFNQAEQQFKEYPELSRRYVVLARKIAMKFKIRFSRDQKKLFCKNCNAYLKQGVNSSIRLVNGHIVLRCKECGNVRRFVYR
jgi:ribonuclease P protein subunit RPR2